MYWNLWKLGGWQWETDKSDVLNEIFENSEENFEHGSKKENKIKLSILYKNFQIFV